MRKVALYGVTLMLVGGLTACSFQKKNEAGNAAQGVAPTTEAPAEVAAPVVPAPEAVPEAGVPVQPAPEAPAENP